MNRDLVYHQHVVDLQHHEQMIIEVTDITDYTLLKHFDSLVESALNDVVFYKDSVQLLEHVRIDYDVKLGSDDILIRCKRYKPSADVYVKHSGSMSAMKIDRDTFRIIIRKPLIEHHMPEHMYDYPVQVTFILNNYNNLRNILADKGLLTQSIDTMMHAVIPKRASTNLEQYQTYAEYYPYSYHKALYVKKIDTEPGDNRKKILY